MFWCQSFHALQAGKYLIWTRSGMLLALSGSPIRFVNKNGILVGYNTDGKGFLELAFFSKGEKMTISGAGGAATAIVLKQLWTMQRKFSSLLGKLPMRRLSERWKYPSHQTKTCIHVLTLEDADSLQVINQSNLLMPKMELV